MSTAPYDLPSHPLAALNGALSVLLHDRSEVLAPLTTLTAEQRALPVFTDAGLARAHHQGLPSEVAASVRVATFAADDWRAKEETLCAAAALGAVRLELDPDRSLTAGADLDLQQALAYVLSHRSGTACL